MHNKSYIKATIGDIINDPRDEQEEIAINTDDINVLTALSKSPYWEVRVAVAQNQNTPWDILVAFADDEVLAVRRAAMVEYSVEIGFAGIIGASEFLEVRAPAVNDADSLHDYIIQHCESDLMDLLEHEESEYLGDDEWEITLNFNGYLGCSETYETWGFGPEDEEDAIYQAMEEAVFDFSVESYEYTGR